MSCHSLEYFLADVFRCGSPTAEQCPSWHFADESPPIMEALEQALSVLPPDPGIWKEMKSPEDRSGEGAWSPLADMGPPLHPWPCQGVPLNWSCSRAGLPHLWPVRHQVPQECDKPLTMNGASTTVSLPPPAQGRTTGTGVKLQGAARARLSMSQVPRGK